MLRKSELTKSLEIVEQIKDLLNKASDLFFSMPTEVQETIRLFHNDTTNLKHVLHWGCNNSEEIRKLWPEVIRQLDCKTE